MSTCYVSMFLVLAIYSDKGYASLDLIRIFVVHFIVNSAPSILQIMVHENGRLLCLLVLGKDRYTLRSEFIVSY